MFYSFLKKEFRFSSVKYSFKRSAVHGTLRTSCFFLLVWSRPSSCMPCVQQVFGVLDSPEYSDVTTGVCRPVINEGKDEQANLPSDGSTVDPLHGFIPAALSGPPTGPIQVTPDQNPEKHLCCTLSS